MAAKLQTVFNFKLWEKETDKKTEVEPRTSLNEGKVDYGRRIGILLETKYNDTVIEVRSTEFKNLLIPQFITNNRQQEKAFYRLRIVYMVQGVMVAHQIHSLRIPNFLLELGDVETALRDGRIRKLKLVKK
ncbi:hypothetical protein BDF21DRAFT_461317 [Thamnidium elegans]|nr:hypothetical protein BDF21DRAFT_461317 [Thamnidium elegans]